VFMAVSSPLLVFFSIDIKLIARHVQFVNLIYVFTCVTMLILLLFCNFPSRSLVVEIMIKFVMNSRLYT